MSADKFLNAAAIVFYVLCWFVEQPTKWLWYIGVGLPWLSLLASLPVYIIFTTDVRNEGKVWGTMYVIMCVAYMVVGMILQGNIIMQTPYLATCVTFIAISAMKKNEDRE